MYYMYNSSVRAQTHLIAFPLLFLSPFFLYCTKYIDLFFVRWICVCVCVNVIFSVSVFQQMKIPRVPKMKMN